MYDFQLIIDSLPLLIQGAGVTLQITIISVGLGLIFGLFIGIAQISQMAIFRIPAKVYVDFLRGTPLLVQIFMIYFALPMLIGTRIDPFVAAIVACSVNSSAYVAEIFRAGIQSIDKGQMEAGRSLGMSKGLTMRKIILPQAVKNILPALGNEAITLLKETSISCYLAITDITYVATMIRSRTFSPVPLLTIAVIYLAIVMLMTFGLRKLERRLSRSER